MSLIKDPKVGGAVAAIVLIAAVGYTVMSSDSGPEYREINEFWYYDVTTKALFAGPTDAVAPIDAPSGGKQADGRPAGVRAINFGCGNCKEKYIGYLQQYQPDGVALMKSGKTHANREAMKHLQIADPADLAWHPWESEASTAIQKKAFSKCPANVETVPCEPGE